VPDYAIDQSYSIELGGDAPAVTPLSGASTGTPGLRVDGGSLRIASTAASSDIQVAAGSCLVPSELQSGEHGLLGYLAAGSCPQ
jgi:hypothetical protein